MDKTDKTNITNKGLENIKKQYDKLTYFDNYGGSVILFILITILLVFLITSCISLTNLKIIKEDWVNQRCKPYIIPIAGFINKPDNMSFNEFTKQNFVYCTQNILKSISGNALEPISFITSSSTKILNYMKDAINDSRAMTNKMRNFFITVTKEIMGRLLNIIIPIQEIIIKFKDFAVKVQGTMAAGVFSTLGILYTIKSALSLVVKFIVTVLISLAAMIVVFWLFPFTWGTAIAATATFVAVSIPLALLLTFMTKVLGINTGLSIPKLKPPPSLKCFDKNTKLIMKNGTSKTITELEVGERLFNNNLITSKIVVESKGSVMYNLNNVVVSDSHMVKYQNKWMRVEEHPNAIKLEQYNEAYLYCINTENKIIEINNVVFSDWDEIYDDDLDKIKNVKIKNLIYNFNNSINYRMDELDVNNLDIHRYLDGGFEKNTEIKLKNGVVKSVKHISIGDILENGERVYGYVEIDGSNLNEQGSYNLAKNKFINGGPNLNICDKTMGFTSTLELDKKYKQFKITSDYDDKLYHLLTDSKTFCINGIKFYDYNSCIDLFLEKYRGKLLSMKYV
jgi:hypothetical protein